VPLRASWRSRRPRRPLRLSLDEAAERAGEVLLEPGTGGRDTNSDNTEFLKIRLDQRLGVEGDCDDDDRHGYED
jgi:hypothetical protein